MEGSFLQCADFNFCFIKSHRLGHLVNTYFVVVDYCSILKFLFSREHGTQINGVRKYLRGGADTSLAHPGRKQATVTKFGIYSTNSPRSSVHFLACCCNFCKPLKKKFRRLSVQPGLHGSNELHVGRKMATFQLFFQSREQVVVRWGHIWRIEWVIKILGSPGRPVSSGLQVPSEPGHCHVRTRPPW